MCIGISFQLPSLFSSAPLGSEPHFFPPITFTDMVLCYLFFKQTQILALSIRKLPAKFYKILCLNSHVLKSLKILFPYIKCLPVALKLVEEEVLFTPVT